MSESHEVDLDEIIDDDLEGRWFHYIRSKDFGWMVRIPDQHHLEVEKDDVIIHKEIKEDSRYPTVRYHLVFEDEAFMVEGDDIRDILAENLKEYVDQHNELPFACHFDKIFKNGKVKITYKPSDYDSFVLKLPEALYPLENINFE